MQVLGFIRVRLHLDERYGRVPGILSVGAFVLSAAFAALDAAARSSRAGAVPMGVLLNMVADAVADYMHLPSQLAAANQALEEINNLLQWWDSISLMQRKTLAVKKQCVLTVENATLAMCASRTAVQQQQAEEEEEEE